LYLWVCTLFRVNTRERLVESARALLWERGYVGTSPKTIQQRADAGQGSMYHHFAGKEDLALAAIRRTADDMRATVDAQLSASGTAVERITAYLHRERDVWLRARLAAVLQEGLDRGELESAVDPASTAAAIVAALQGGYVLARAADTTEPFDQAVAGVLALLSARTVH
jgi:TetR/AcrR family transcriptional regulator, transcriptional repressor for nem operon